MDDNVYPNPTEYFDPIAVPEEIKRAKSDERAKVRESKKLIDEVISHWDERIAFYDTLKSIPDEVLSDDNLFARRVLANKEVILAFQAEKAWLDELKRSY